MLAVKALERRLSQIYIAMCEYLLVLLKNLGFFCLILAISQPL